MKVVAAIRLCSLAALGLAAFCVVPGPVRAQGPAGASGNFANGQRLASGTCAACHGADGNSSEPTVPKLAGQSAPYLYQQLMDFQSGVRRSAMMAPMTKPLSLADMADLATFYSGQSVRPDTATDPKLAEAGQNIFNSFGSGPFPPCVACHGSAGGFGMMGRGMMGGMRGMAAVPQLADQHAAYIVAQLDQFASGARPSTVMGRIAATLTDNDKKAVAAYLAGLH
jgi:cytochrome c553